MYHLIFIVKIKNNMKVCILGNGLSSLTLAKALVNQNIYVELITQKKNLKIGQSRTLGISKSNIDFFKIQASLRGFVESHGNVGITFPP